LRQIESIFDSGLRKCQSIQLFRIFSTQYLPLDLQYSSTNQKAQRILYFLCVLSETSKLNYLKDNTEQNPNEIKNDTLSKTCNIQWMDHQQLVNAQKTHILMGLEPMLFFKKIVIDKQQQDINLSVDQLFYEPKISYFYDVENSSSTVDLAQLPTADQLVASAKFTKNSNFKKQNFQDSFLLGFLISLRLILKPKINCTIFSLSTHIRVNI
jgi:hypothetical protein